MWGGGGGGGERGGTGGGGFFERKFGGGFFWEVDLLGRGGGGKEGGGGGGGGRAGGLGHDTDLVTPRPVRPRRVTSEDGHLPAVTAAEPLENLERRGLARTVRTEQGENLSRVDVQVQAVDRDEVTVASRQTPDVHDGRRRPIGNSGQSRTSGRAVTRTASTAGASVLLPSPTSSCWLCCCAVISSRSYFVARPSCCTLNGLPCADRVWHRPRGHTPSCAPRSRPDSRAVSVVLDRLRISTTCTPA